MGDTLTRHSVCCTAFTRAEYINKLLVTDAFVTSEFPYSRVGDDDGDNCPNANGGGAGESQCGPWPDQYIPTSGGGYVLQDGNLYELNPDTTLRSAICPGPGFKAAQTFKVWHGMNAFDFCVDGCTGQAVKYLKLTIVISGIKRSTDTPCDQVDVYHEERIFTVNRVSGEITKSGMVCDSWNRVQTSPGVWENITQLHPGSSDYYVMDPCDPDAEPGPYAFYKDMANNISHTLSKSGTSIEYHLVNARDIGSDDPDSPCYRPYQEYVTDGGLLITDQYDVVVTLSNPYYSVPAGGTPNVLADANDAIFFWSLKNHYLMPSRDTDTWRSVGQICKYKEVETPVSPFSGPDNCEQIDDYRNPTAGSGTEGDPYTAWEQMDWVDMAVRVWIYASEPFDPALNVATDLIVVLDGSLIGKPFTVGDGSPGFPQGKPDKNWDWKRQIWGCYEDFTGFHSEVRWYGASSGTSTHGDDTGSVIATSANKWTEILDAGNLPGTLAVALWSGTDRLWLQKGIESAVKFDGYNFFGPAGMYRYVFKHANSGPILSTTGDPDDPAEGDVITYDPIAAIADGDAVVYLTIENLLGGVTKATIFEATAVGSGTLTLGPKDEDARNVLDAYSLWTAINPDTGFGVPTGDFGVIGKIRDWKRSGVSFVPPSIWGKVAATVAQDTDDPTKVKVTWGGSQKYTKPGDLVAFVQNDDSDTANNDNSESGWPLTDTTDAYVKFTGTYDSGTMKGLVKILDAPLAIWNTRKSRNDFLWLTAADDGAGGFDTAVAHDDRHRGVNTSLGCTPSDDLAAAESITDSYPLGTGYPFPATSASTCGAKSGVAVQQLMRHPLVEAPYCTPYTGGAAACDGFTICLPKIEAMTQDKFDAYVSDGAPELPDDCTLDVSTSVPDSPGTHCDPPVLLPNGVESSHSQCTSPWVEQP